MQGEGISSNAQEVSRSILAGCKHSIAFVKMYLHDDLSRLAREHPDTSTSAYVDDITVSIRHHSKYDLAIAALDAMQSFAAIAAKLKLVLSEKGQLVCSDVKLGTQVAKSLRKTGIPVTHVHQARDLGIINAAGKPVRRIGVSSRVLGTRHRVNSTKKLARISPMAR